MGDPFFLAFLSKNTVEELRILFKDEKPSPKKLHKLIDKLAKYQAPDNLQLLLDFIEEADSSDPENTRLAWHIHQRLLSMALEHSNLINIGLQLDGLQEIAAVNSDNQWQDSLPDLINWMEKPQKEKDLNALIAMLPHPLREKLYQNRLEVLEANRPWLPTLINFVINHPECTSNQPEIRQHLQTLAICLLRAPLDCDPQQITLLSLRLSTEELVSITFQLRAIAATYAANNQTRLCYLNHYETLVTALTVRATVSNAEYQVLAENNAELANLLMSKRLRSLEALEDQRALVNELLEQASQFDWKEVQFNSLAMERIIKVFKSLPPQALKNHFERYYRYHSKNNPGNVIRFLDKLFEKYYEPELVLACLDHCDDEDKTLTIYFLTNSQIHDNYLTEQCLIRLNEIQLIHLCGHIVALKQLLQQQEQAPLIEVYFRVLCEKIRSGYVKPFTELARYIALLPASAQDEPLQVLFTQLNSDIHLQCQCLMALLASDCDKRKLMGFCHNLLRGISLNDQVELLKCFNSEEFFELYLYMVRHQAPEQDFNGFVELFKENAQENSREPLLHYMLLHTPLIGQSFLDKLMSTIDSRNLITLIEELILLVQKDNNYQPSLQQLLVHFCSRLQVTVDDNDPIHQWVMCEYHSLFAWHLLASPACFTSLASRSSTLQNITPNLLQGWVVTSPYTDLHLRAMRVLEEVQLDEASADRIALPLLNQFCHQPQNLQALFVNLESVQTSLSEAGKMNYDFLKKACWALLKNRKLNTYDAKTAGLLLTTQLTQPHRFDAVLARLATNLSNMENAALSAEYLTRIDSANLASIEPATLVTLLFKSMDENTRCNWEKTTLFLQAGDVERTLQFIKLLIHHESNCPNNPLLVEQVLQFILHLPRFETLLPLLEEEELLWIVKQNHETYLYEQFPGWLDILLANQCFDRVDGGALLMLLPQNQNFLDQLLQHKSLQPYLPSIFIAFSNQDQSTVHFIALFQQILQQDDEEKRKFIAYAQKNLKPQQRLSVAAPVLNMLLLSIPDLQITRAEDRDLVINQLRLFNQWVSNPAIEALHQPFFVYELQQLIFNTLTALSDKDSRWASLILCSEAFAALALTWLPEVDSKAQDQHPFTKALLKNITIKFDPILTDSPVYQHYIKQLLTYPPAALTDDFFAILFDNLNPQEQRALALNLLQRPTLDDVQWSSLLTLAPVLPIETLFAIYEKSTTRFIFVDLLVQHPQGIEKLSTQQINTLLANLETGKQLLRILDSHAPKITKITFVTAIFRYLQYKQLPLASWLESLVVDGPTLAALANYTQEEQHQQQLLEIIQTSSLRTQDIQRFLQNPSLDLPIEPTGLLYQFIKNVWFNPGKGWQCHPDLLQILDPAEMLQALKKQQAFLTQVQLLEGFYEPLSGCGEVANELLIAARWLQRLPLLTDGFLEIVYEYQTTTNDSLRKTIETMPIFQRFIAPLLKATKSNELIAIQLNELFDLLNHYFENLKTPHKASPKAVLNKFQLQIQAMTFRSPQRLSHLFQPGSYFGKINKDTISHLPAVEIENLSSALEQHRQFLAEKNNSPNAIFLALLLEAADNNTLLNDSAMQAWLLRDCLFSPLTQDISIPLLNQLISNCDPLIFAEEMTTISQKIRQYGQSFNNLSCLKSLDSIEKVISSLKSSDRQLLARHLEACEFAKLPCLANLILLTLHINRTDLSADSLKMLLPGHLTHDLEMDWVYADLKKMEHIKNLLLQRHQAIELTGFKYHRDGNNAKRLAQLPETALNTCDAKILAICLNSYLPIFKKSPDKKAATRFLQTLYQLLEHADDQHALLSKLKDELLNQALAFALQNPRQYEPLLQFFIQGEYRQKCAGLIKTCLSQLLATALPGNSDLPPQTLLDLSTQNLAEFPATSLEPVLWMQRLLFYIEPWQALKNWQENTADGRDLKGHYFAADASLLAWLMQFRQGIEGSDSEIPKTVIDNLDRGLQFLSKESKALSYWPLMESLCQKNTLSLPASVQSLVTMDSLPAPSVIDQESPFLYPPVCFLGLHLFAFLTKKPQILVEGFVNWLEQIDSQTLEQQVELHQLLQTLLDKNLVSVLCKALQDNPVTDVLKLNWLFANMAQAKTLDSEWIQHLVTAFSWDWLQEQIQSSRLNGLAILQIALQRQHHLLAISNSKLSQNNFLKLLAHCQLPVNDLVLMQNNLNSVAVRSLLAIHLLGRQDYLQNIEGKSLLDQLTPLPEKRLKRRLQPLIQRLDFRQLTEERINMLLPEAAANLLCSPSHFHLLDETKIQLLLKVIGGKAEAILQYWLHFYASMPNNEQPLIVLTYLFTKKIPKIIEGMESDQQHALIATLIEYHHQLKPETTVNLNGLIHFAQESHLALSIQYYLHAQEPSEILIQLIKNLFDLILANKNLTAETLRLLIRLTDDNHFADCREKLTLATGDYLRSSALFSDCSIFYDDGRIAIQRLKKPVSLVIKRSEKETKGGFLLNLFSWHNSTESPFNDLNLNQLPDNPMLDMLSRVYDSIPSINYFLIHFKGDTKALQNCLDDYISDCVFSAASTENLECLRSTSWFMTQEDLPAPTRQVLFESFFKYLNVVDEQITAHLLRYDANSIIKQLASTNSYDSFIRRCQATYPHLDNCPEVKTILSKALEEAHFEASLTTISAFLHRWRVWLSRCLFYGWTGLFTPNKPRYVPPFETCLRNDIHEMQPFPMDEANDSRHEKESLEILLRELTPQSSLQQIIALHDALIIYEWTENKPDVLALRIAIDSLFTALLEEASVSKRLDDWLTGHNQPFLLNRKKLIALYCQTNDETALINLLEKVRVGPGHLKALAKEFHVDSPPPLIKVGETPSIPPAQESSLFGNLLSGVASIPLLFWSTSKTTPTEATEPVATTNSTGGWFG